MYRIVFTKKAEADIRLLYKYVPLAVPKLKKLLEELKVHPYTGTGQIESLKYHNEPTFSRRLNREHRIVYRVYDDIVEVLVISAYGHYE